MVDWEEVPLFEKRRRLSQLPQAPCSCLIRPIRKLRLLLLLHLYLSLPLLLFLQLQLALLLDLSNALLVEIQPLAPGLARCSALGIELGFARLS